MDDILKELSARFIELALIGLFGWLWGFVRKWVAGQRRMQAGFLALYARDRAIVDLVRQLLYRLEERNEYWDLSRLKEQADDLRDDLWRVDGNESRDAGRKRREWPGREALEELLKNKD